MGVVTAGNSGETGRLLRRAAAGDQDSWGALLTRHEERLRRMVAFRMDQRLQGRIDPLDVIQEAYLEASEHQAEFLRQPPLPFSLGEIKAKMEAGLWKTIVELWDYAMHGLVAWVILGAVGGLIAYALLLPILKRAVPAR